jgi:putative transcriptional regulator
LAVEAGAERALDTLLAGYASGTLSPAMHALMGAHLQLSRESRSFVSSLEAAHGSALEAVEPTVLRNRDGRLAAIVAQAESRESIGPCPVRPAPLSSEISPCARLGRHVPSPLRRFLGTDLECLPWRPTWPGVQEARIEAEEEVALMWIQPGRCLPAHTHAGTEVMLVLKGSLADRTGYYRRGAIAIIEAETEHSPAAGTEEDCLCFAVTEDPALLPLARARRVDTLRAG